MLVRDDLYTEERYTKKETLNRKFIRESLDEVEELLMCEKQGVQKYPTPNMEIIPDNYRDLVRREMEIICCQYSMGKPVDDLMDDFTTTITYMENTYQGKIGYLYMLWMISIGVMLETDIANIKRLAVLVEREGMEDYLIDYILQAVLPEWKKSAPGFVWGSPYDLTKEIISLAGIDKKLASERLFQYAKKEWFKGHSDCDWKNTHKEPGNSYVGYWSFESGALSKILELDDSKLKGYLHYPYDLAHYREGFKGQAVFAMPDGKREEAVEAASAYESGISQNPKLEQMFPPCFHKDINELIKDYKAETPEHFFEMYRDKLRLGTIWLSKDEYAGELKAKGDMLGTLIVFYLVMKGYIIQIDYNEESSDHLGRFINNSISNMWHGTAKIEDDFDGNAIGQRSCNDAYLKYICKKIDSAGYRLLKYDLGNDQEYFSVMPKENRPGPTLYNVKVEFVDSVEILPINEI